MRSEMGEAEAKMGEELEAAEAGGARSLGYNGKRFTLPELSREGFAIPSRPGPTEDPIPSAQESPIMADLNSVWDLRKFLTPRLPVSLGMMTPEQSAAFSRPGVPRTLDMPIKFPGSEYRIPKEFEQFAGLIERVARFEAAINGSCLDEYYCYMTVDQGMLTPGALQREAPCHVDGFQGARWNPKTRINHTYVASDLAPTTYYPQAFDFSKLDEARHNFFWEMNRQVAERQSAGAWRPQEREINLIDAYTVHRGSEAKEASRRTWIRLSFETRVFDRLGNAHNPMFQYDWPMVRRDIESLNLSAFDESSDPSLRVFPWQSETGEPNPDGRKTKPRLGGEAE